MASLPYGPPVQVSPLIRGIRFGLLIAGFFYAQGKKALYSRMEASHKIAEAKRKEQYEKDHAHIKAKIAEEERQLIKNLESGKL